MTYPTSQIILETWNSFNMTDIYNQRSGLSIEDTKQSTIIGLILKDIKFVLGIDRSIVQDQERSWMKFNTEILLVSRLLIQSIIKEETGLNTRWHSNCELEIEYLTESELEDAHTRKTVIKKKKMEEYERLLKEKGAEPIQYEPWRVKPSRKTWAGKRHVAS